MGRNIARANLAREETEKQDPDYVGTASGYIGCKRCTDPDQPEIFGLFVAGNKTCDPAKIDGRYYRAVTGTSCTIEEEFCVENDTALLAKSPNECLDEAYQTRKKVYSSVIKACAELNQAYGHDPLDPPPFAEQCPVYAFNHFKCRSTDKKCRYVPAGCTGCTGDPESYDYLSSCDCSGVDESIVKACMNSFDGCEDTEYKADVAAAENISQKCAEEYQAYLDLDKYGTWGSLAAYILIIALIVLLYLRGGKKAEQQQQLYGGPPTDSTLREMGYVRKNENVPQNFNSKTGFFGISLVRNKLVFGFMLFSLLSAATIGYLMLAMAGNKYPFQSGEFKEKYFGTFDDASASSIGTALIIAGLVLSVVLITYKIRIMLALKKK